MKLQSDCDHSNWRLAGNLHAVSLGLVGFLIATRLSCRVFGFPEGERPERVRWMQCYCHFCSTLLVKTITKSQPHFRRRVYIDPVSHWEADVKRLADMI